MKRVLRVLSYGALILVLLLILILFVLPDSVSAWIVFFIIVILNNLEWIGHGVLALLGGVALYWIFSDRQRIKRRALALTASVVAAYAGICLISILHQSSYGRCDHYTQELNGGIRTVNGKQYTIQLCGTKRLWGGGEEVRLQVLSEEGRLLARRYSVFYWNDPGEVKLRHYKGTTIYYGAEANGGATQSIHLPPTCWDWITARLPLFD
ncbi:MAG: hypothetical protein QM739_14755 [Propionivibrio sp.]